MFPTRWLKSLTRSRTHRGSVPRPRFRPAVEGLEAREVPAILAVTTTADVVADDGLLSLREAVLQSNATIGADTIVVPPGHYPLSLGLLNLTANTRVLGSTTGQTVLDGQMMGSVVGVSYGAQVDISNVTVVNGYPGVDNGGTLTMTSCTVANNLVAGINNPGSLVLRQSVIRDNTSYWVGGGIASSGKLAISDCIITGNRAVRGGGVYSDSVFPAQMSRCQVTHNVARYGGGIAVEGAPSYASMTISDSTIAGNTATAGGGIASSVPLTVRNCVVTGNAAIRPSPNGRSVGGGIDALDVTLIDTTLTSNSADLGGALYVEGTAVLNHCNLGGNSALQGGAVYCVPWGDLTVCDSTITGNSATEFGGGIANFGSLTLRDSVVTANLAPLGGDLYNVGLVYLFDSTVGDRYDG